MGDNFRPVQPLNQRTLFSSDRDGDRCEAPGPASPPSEELDMSVGGLTPLLALLAMFGVAVVEAGVRDTKHIDLK